MTQLSQAEAEPLDEQNRPRGTPTQAGHAMPQVGQTHPQQPRPRGQALPPGVAIADDGQYKGCLGPRVCAAAAVIAV